MRDSEDVKTLTEPSVSAREDAEPERGEAGCVSGPCRITEAAAQKGFVSLAVKLDENRAETQRLITGLDRKWPDSIVEDVVPPDLAFSLFGAAETVAEYLDEAIDRAWSAVDDTAESVRSEWEARHQVSRAERMAELLSSYAETAEDADVGADVETRILAEVVEDLSRLKRTVLAARSRLPRRYPELEKGEPSRQAVLHGDLGILVGTLEAAISQARTAATSSSKLK